MEISNSWRMACVALLLPLGMSAAEKADSVTNNRLSKLEKIVDKLPRVSGFVNLGYTMDKAEDGECDNTFNMRRARLDFKGEVMGKVDYRMQVEFAGSFKLLDAYVNYKPLKELQFQAGEFKIPFTLENEYGPHTLETPENSMSIKRLCNYGPSNLIPGVASSNGRDVGVMLHGGAVHRKGYDVVNYAAGVFNGQGINLKDNNREKDLSMRLTLRPNEWFSLSGSYYLGSYENSLKQTDRRHRTAAGFKVDDGKLLVRSEYLWSTTNTTGNTKSNGAYAVVAYKVTPKWQPLLKYDYFQEVVNVDATREHDCTAGVNFLPTKNFRLQAFYTFQAKCERKNNHQVSLQFFAQF